ncbi:MAG TPA: universal stress protein [Dehalococcoidia bacterium]|nr:universal stress protein [Dehalococcoidia bacterium]
MPVFKVLVPLDGSRVAEHSLVYLDALRNMGDLQVLLLSVVDQWTEAHSLTPTEAGQREDNLLSTYLREVSSDIEKHSGIKVETKVVHGNPASGVLEAAHSLKPDLLIISTHGRSGPSRWRLGSVADKVIRGAESDTLVVGPKAIEQERWMEAILKSPFQSILVPLDGSDLAEAALVKAQAFAAAYGSTIHLVRAVPIPAIADGYPGEAAYIPSLMDQMVEGAQEYLKQVASRLTGVKEVKTDVAIGTAPMVLEDYSRANNVDLVVMTTHGRGGILRTALGSVTDRLLAGGVAPVLVVRPRAG